ncbi:fumarase class II [Prosthecobacter fusiformis]|uniref:Fumarate hydratase class II n=1 Tax=Prosthecobacter fusiformis TaxID=48464 RepID=A0A4R7S174_9BACT|nr:class II fumarate hydratase [Prosthecobacter fusiformis]TDU70935.1 fumarase class II [Prosthecobacter fusiformis]
MNTRIEKDSLGEMPVPAEALYGASTQRAVLNFPVSGQPVPYPIIHAYGLIKWAAARVHQDLGLLAEDKAALIEEAALEVAAGKLDDHFVVDIYQTGSGTSTNMNVNEVIANRACQIAGRAIGSKDPVHPNDHVNMGQSSNDTFPTAIHLAVAQELQNGLLPVLKNLQLGLAQKAEEFWEVLKIGRTHLMDATPVRLGQEFKGYARQMEHGVDRVHKALKTLAELPLGGTAVGTGLNCHPEFAIRAIALLTDKTGLPFREAGDHFEAQAAKDALVEVSGQLKVIATSLFKIANDIRWLGSGPQCAIGEISLPATQPGSSIMPGKVNPVMCESLMQVCARVFGNDATVTWCAASGNFELNVMMPALAAALLESITLMANAGRLFQERCIQGIEARTQRCNEMIEQSLALVTGLNSKIGYDKASVIAKESARTGTPVRQLCLQRLAELGITEEELNEALDPARMCAPDAAMVGAGGG